MCVCLGDLGGFFWLALDFFFFPYHISNGDQTILVSPERLLQKECSITVDLSNSAFTVVIRESLVLLQWKQIPMTSYTTILNVLVRVFTYSFSAIILFDIIASYCCCRC